MTKKNIQIRLTLSQSQYDWFVQQGLNDIHFKKTSFFLEALSMAYPDFPMEALTMGGYRTAKWLLLRRKNYQEITKVMCKRGRWKDKVVQDSDSDDIRRAKDWLIMGEFDSEEQAKRVQQAYKQRVERENAMKEKQSHE